MAVCCERMLMGPANSRKDFHMLYYFVSRSLIQVPK